MPLDWWCVMGDKGFNPMNWNCERQGCFNTEKRPKIEQFHNCFHSNISMSDVDAIVEVNGNILIIEWKQHSQELGIGQRILFQRLTSRANIWVYVVRGCPKTMEIEGYQVISDGRLPTPFEECKTEDFMKILKDFNDWAVKNPCKCNIEIE